MAGSGVTLAQIVLQARQLGFTHWRVFSVPGLTVGLKDERWADLQELLELERVSRKQAGNARWVVVDGGVDASRKILWTVDEQGRRSELPIRHTQAE